MKPNKVDLVKSKIACLSCDGRGQKWQKIGAGVMLRCFRCEGTGEEPPTKAVPGKEKIKCKIEGIDTYIECEVRVWDILDGEIYEILEE